MSRIHITRTPREVRVIFRSEFVFLSKRTDVGNMADWRELFGGFCVHDLFIHSGALLLIIQYTFCCGSMAGLQIVGSYVK